MSYFDRRAWIKTIALAIGGLSISRRGAADQPRRPAGPGGEPRLARLSLNENPYGPAPSVVQALQNQLPNLCRYTDGEYSELVGLIAAKEQVPQEQIILGEILEPLGSYLSLQGGPGGEFIYSVPGYTALIDSAAAVGGVGVGVPLDHRMHNDLPAITAKLSPRTRAVYLVNPHNPTGIAGDADGFREFARAASRRALVIVDEAYLEFADQYARRTLVDLVRAGDDVIVFRTFAKAYGLAGLEIGYGLVPKRIALALSPQGLDNPHLFNRLAVAAATASLRDAHYVAGVARQVAREREKWSELLRSLKVNFTASSGNFVFFETGMPHADFAAALLKQGVDIGRAFPPYDRWARISVGLPEENAAARSAVGQLLSKAGALF